MNYIWTILVSVVSSMITFLITTIIYQTKKEKKREKADVFKVLMSTRNMRDYEAIKALNSIDVIFCDTDSVLSAWHRYRKSLSIDGDPTPKADDEIYESEVKLFEAMAKSLGYKKITWDIIDRPYRPFWLTERVRGQQNQARYYNDLYESKSDKQGDNDNE